MSEKKTLGDLLGGLGQPQGSPFVALLSTSTAGSYRVRATQLDLGFFVGSNGGESQSRKVFYPNMTSTSSFSMTIAFPDYEGRERFSSWLRNFMKKTVNGKGFRASIRIDVPSHDFSRVAIPTGPLTYGEGVKDVGYFVSVRFTGASDPINAEDRKARSFFQAPKKDKGAGKFYYPATTVFGSEESESNVFDAPIFDGLRF